MDQLSEKSGLRVDTIVVQIVKCASLLYDIDFSQALREDYDSHVKTQNPYHEYKASKSAKRSHKNGFESVMMYMKRS